MQFSLKRLFVGVTVVAVIAGVARLVSEAAFSALVFNAISTAVVFSANRLLRLSDSSWPLRSPVVMILVVAPVVLLATMAMIVSGVAFVGEIARPFLRH